jgi:hypothetical protein
LDSGEAILCAAMALRPLSGLFWTVREVVGRDPSIADFIPRGQFFGLVIIGRHQEAGADHMDPSAIKKEFFAVIYVPFPRFLPSYCTNQ